LKQAGAGQNTSQAVYGSHCLCPVEPGYQSAISATFGKREKQNAGAWCRYAQAGTNLLWCCKTSERIPPTGSLLRCCERAGEMVSTLGRRGGAPHQLPRSGSLNSGCKPQKPSRSDGQIQGAAAPGYQSLADKAARTVRIF